MQLCAPHDSPTQMQMNQGKCSSDSVVGRIESLESTLSHQHCSLSRLGYTHVYYACLGGFFARHGGVSRHPPNHSPSIHPSIRPQISRVREGNFVVCVAVTTHGLNRPKICDPDLVIVSLNAPPISFSINLYSHCITAMQMPLVVQN